MLRFILLLGFALVALCPALLIVGCPGTSSSGETGFDFGETGSFCRDTGATDLLYADIDADGFGDVDAALSKCDAPEGFVADATDCNDGLATVNPSAVEVCGDALDQDCSGADLACTP